MSSIISYYEAGEYNQFTNKVNCAVFCLRQNAEGNLDAICYGPDDDQDVACFMAVKVDNEGFRLEAVPMHGKKAPSSEKIDQWVQAHWFDHQKVSKLGLDASKYRVVIFRDCVIEDDGFDLAICINSKIVVPVVGLAKVVLVDSTAKTICNYAKVDLFGYSVVNVMTGSSTASIHDQYSSSVKRTSGHVEVHIDEKEYCFLREVRDDLSDYEKYKAGLISFTELCELYGYQDTVTILDRKGSLLEVPFYKQR